jgi:hypothetical protein
MTTRHTITRANEAYRGDVLYQKYTPDGRAGVLMPNSFVVEFGTVTTADPDGIVDFLNPTAAGTLSMSGALVSGGVATLDVARAVRITSTGNESGLTFTVSGTDHYGETMTEAITGPNATTADGVKAFKTVNSIHISGDLTATGVDIGTNTILGVPVRIKDKGKVLGFFVDGVPESTLTVVAGLAATGTSTATTADARGTLKPNTAPNGSKYMTAMLLTDGNAVKANVFGAAQA